MDWDTTPKHREQNLKPTGKNKRKWKSVITACGYSMCKVSKHLRNHSSKDIIRAVQKYVGTFWKLSAKADIAGLLEWVVVYRCRHCPEDHQWKDQ